MSRSADDSVIEWLLEDDNPCIKYLTLSAIRGRARSAEALEARDRIAGWNPAKRILDRQHRNGGWDDGTCCYIPKYKSTVWQALLLSQTGVDPALPKIARMCEYVLRFETSSGGIRADSSKPSDWGERASCLNGNMIASLCRLGLRRNPRVARSAEHLVSLKLEDGGWSCKSLKTPSSGQHSCIMGTVCALEGLLEYSAERKVHPVVSHAIEDGCEFLLMHRLFRADHHNWRIINPEWTRLSAPYTWRFNILRGLRALSMAGNLDDRRAEEALKIVESKRNPNGRWIREAPWSGNTYSSFGREGREDKWVTLDAMTVLGRLPRTL